MIKALALAGLLEHRPHYGVKLTANRVATKQYMLLRRHRIVELFLVKILGMDWSEVHEEAEQLEHVVSDEVISRMDDLLGHPSHDPHGDPIPSPDGTLPSSLTTTFYRFANKAIAYPLHELVIRIPHS